MTSTETIKQTITDFVNGGDSRDIKLLDKVLHKDFRVASNNFMGKAGFILIDKQKLFIDNAKKVKS